MDVLLDTHALLWFLKGDNSLSAKAKKIISENNNIKYVSTATIWEIKSKKWVRIIFRIGD
jgi:PIN domain nuclease of toxin-antitoxin system